MKKLTGKKKLSFSFYLYRFGNYVSYGFPIINFFNSGVHYESPVSRKLNWRCRQKYMQLYVKWSLKLCALIVSFFTMAQQPQWARASSLSRIHDHTQTHHHTTLGRTTLDEWSARRRDLLPDNTQHSQETDFHAPGGIRTHNPSKRAAAHPRLRLRDYWERPNWKFSILNSSWQMLQCKCHRNCVAVLQNFTLPFKCKELWCWKW